MAKPANSAEAPAPPLALRSPPPGHTRHPGDRRRSSGDLCAPSPGAGSPRTPRAPRALGTQLRKLWNPGPMLGGGGQAGCTTLYRFLAIQVIFTPWSPLGPQSPAPFLLPPLKPPPGPAMEARRGPGCGTGSPAPRPRASPPPRRPLRVRAPQPPDFSPPTARLLCCSDSLGSLECTGLAELKPCRPPPHGWGRDRPREGERRGGMRKEELELQCRGRLERPRPGSYGDLPAASGHKMGGNRKSWPVVPDSAGILTGLRIVQLGRLQRVDSSGLRGRDKG